jgi:hypothetical protein
MELPAPDTRTRGTGLTHTEDENDMAFGKKLENVQKRKMWMRLFRTTGSGGSFIPLASSFAYEISLKRITVVTFLAEARLSPENELRLFPGDSDEFQLEFGGTPPARRSRWVVLQLRYADQDPETS